VLSIAALTWPEAAVYMTGIAALGLVLSVLVWSIFRTGQTAIRMESRPHRQQDDDPRTRLEPRPEH
jgi:hypothetical protein